LAKNILGRTKALDRFDVFLFVTTGMFGAALIR